MLLQALAVNLLNVVAAFLTYILISLSMVVVDVVVKLR